MSSDWIPRRKGRRAAAKEDGIGEAPRRAAATARSDVHSAGFDGTDLGSLDPQLLAQLRALQDWAVKGGEADWLPLEPPEAVEQEREGRPGVAPPFVEAPRPAGPETGRLRPMIRRRVGEPPTRIPVARAATRHGRLGLPRAGLPTKAAMIPLLLLALAAASLRAPSRIPPVRAAAAPGASLSAAIATARDATSAQAAPWRSHHGPLTLRELAAAGKSGERGEDGSRGAAVPLLGPSRDAYPRTTVPESAGPRADAGMATALPPLDQAQSSAPAGQSPVTPAAPDIHGTLGSENAAGTGAGDASNAGDAASASNGAFAGEVPPQAGGASAAVAGSAAPAPSPSSPTSPPPPSSPPPASPAPKAAPEIQPPASPPPLSAAAGEAAPSRRTRRGRVALLQLDPVQRPRGELRRPAGLSGRWVIQDVVRSTTYPPYRQLRLTYRVALRQVGERVSGDGEKWEENGRPLPRARRTPIHLAGNVVGSEVRVRFTEQGARRASEGSFRWHLSPGGDRFTGTFAGEAANARGSSAAARLANDPPPHPVARAYAFVRHLAQSVRTRLHAAHPSP